MKHLKLNSLAAAIGLATASGAFAQSSAPANSSTPASGSVPEELYVIGQRLEETTPQKLAEFGNRLETLTPEQLKLGGFDDVSQALQMQTPGLYVAPKNGAFDYVNCSLQGARCKDMIWLVDGVRTSNRLYATTTPLDTIPAGMIERVEVLYGGQGIFYGTQSIAGVINIVTKSFSDSPTGTVTVGGDQNGGTHVNGDYRTKIGDHQLVFFASKDEADGFQPFPDSAIQPSSFDRERGYDVTTIGAKYAYDFTDRSRISVLYERTDADLDFAAPSSIAVAKNERIDDWITAKWDYTASDTVNLYVKSYWHNWDSHYTEIDNDIGPGGVLTGTRSVIDDHDFWGFNDYGVTGVAEFAPADSFTYAVGYDYQRFWGKDDVWLIDDKTETAQAVYGQIRTSESQLKNTRLALGVRYNKTSETFDGTVWNFSGQHDFEHFYLRGQVGTSFRLPDAEELYLLFQNGCGCEVGNPNLEPEESKNIEVGIGSGSKSARGASWELTLFSREISNLIQIDFNQPAFPDGIYENANNKVNSNGWEFGVGVGLGQAMNLNFDYTRTTAEFENTTTQIQDIPKDTAKVDWSYHGMSTPFEMNIALLRVGDVFDQVGSNIGIVDHGNYTVVDVGAAYFLDKDRRHRIGARLENALDEDYASSIGRAFRDVDDSPYAYRNLGTPRTLHLSYTYNYK